VSGGRSIFIGFLPIEYMALEADFKVGQFGKIGEHMVGFELSKRGWIIFYPPYDERVDIVAMKFRCKKCKSSWLNEHRIACVNSKCSEFEKPIATINSKKQYKNKVCKKCGHIEKRTDNNAQKEICPRCSGTMEEVALCPQCHKEIEVLGKNCSKFPECDSTNYEVLFRSIQVKSSHLVDNGKNIGFNFRYQDLIDDKRHFLIVYNRRIINDVERHFYWIMSKKDFKKAKGNINTTSYKIYQNDRGHYPLKALEEFRFNEEEFYKLQEEKEKADKEGKKDVVKQIAKKQQEIDAFRRLD